MASAARWAVQLWPKHFTAERTAPDAP
jgi:hypothetical protein